MGTLRRPCSNCGRPTRVSPCPACRDRSHHRGRSRAARGYDAVYERNRAEMLRVTKRALEAGRSVLCQICAQPLTLADKITAEHIIPLRRGGTNALRNLGPAHARCNYGWRKG